MRTVCLAVVLSLVVCGGTEERFDKAAAKIIDLVNALDADGLFKMYNGQMQDALPARKTKSFLTGLQGQFGNIEKIESRKQFGDMAAQYRIKMQRGVLNLEFALDAQDKIAGLFFKPAAADMSTAASVKHETKLQLPFKGQWLIFWGGDSEELGGHHLQARGQRFAFDILGVGPDGKTRRGEGGKNEDYYAFGREILAPGDGIVTDVISGVRDNNPGVLNPYSAVGNAVLIEHRPGEVSVLAHLKSGSIRVKPGDRVKQGQLIALCGNSGNSSEPHLHYHLQNSTSLAEGVGVKVRFASLNVTREGKPERKTEYSPIKGDIVSE
jgi:murein DD-endopeptidase MepM/ murein hydrolase activator NlpD